jgi:homoserine O-acetyltransferase
VLISIIRYHCTLFFTFVDEFNKWRYNRHYCVTRTSHHGISRKKKGGFRMLINDYYSQDVHGPFELFDLGDFRLEEGGTIRNCKLAFSTFGVLNAAKDNAILITTWYSGTNKIMEQVYTGKGRAIDPDKYFVVIANQLGGGLSSSPHNTPSPFNMSRFPDICVSDDVNAQHRLLTEKFGIERLELVVGGSLGAQQTYEWAVRYPEMVKRAAPIAGTAKTTLHDVVLIESMIDTITSHPAWNGGWYVKPHAVQAALRRHARYWAVMGLSPRFFNEGVWKEIGFSSLDDFIVGFLENYFLPMDPNDLLCQLRKHLRADVGRTAGGDLHEALSRISAKTFVMPIDTDMLFFVKDCEYEQKSIPNSELRVIRSRCGHLGLFGIEAEDYAQQIDRNLRELLATPA